MKMTGKDVTLCEVCECSYCAALTVYCDGLAVWYLWYYGGGLGGRSAPHQLKTEDCSRDASGCTRREGDAWRPEMEEVRERRAPGPGASTPRFVTVRCVNVNSTEALLRGLVAACVCRGPARDAGLAAFWCGVACRGFGLTAWGLPVPRRRAEPAQAGPANGP